MVTSRDIRDFMVKARVVPADPPIGDDESLFEHGVIDSLKLMDCVAALEESFGIRVDQDDLIPDHFDTIDGMARYVAQKQPAST